MQTLRYAGVDVHKECIVVAVLDERGKVVMGSVIETAEQPLAYIDCQGTRI